MVDSIRYQSGEFMENLLRNIVSHFASKLVMNYEVFLEKIEWKNTYSGINDY